MKLAILFGTHYGSHARMLHADRSFNRVRGQWGIDGRIPFTRWSFYLLTIRR